MVPTSDHTWIVDPLDGTSNYAHGLPFACVSVAVKRPDGVVVGAIFEPFRGELFTAARGRWCVARRQAHHGEDCRSSEHEVSAADSLSRALVCTGLQSDDPDQIAAHARRIVALHLVLPAARARSGRRRCAWRTSPPAGIDAFSNATPRTPGTSPPGRC